MCLETKLFFENFFKLMPDGSFNRDVEIHPSAIIEDGARLGMGIKIGPFCTIGSKAIIEDNVFIGPYSVIDGCTTIGADSVLFSYVTLGAVPQHVRFKGEQATLIIGKKNTFKQYVNISLGTEIGHNETIVGSNNTISSFSHVGHDGIIGDNIFIGKGVHLGGHVIVQDNVHMVGMTGVHQFVRIGKCSHLEVGSMVSQDVAPFSRVQGDRATVIGLNEDGLKIAGITGDRADLIKKMFEFFFSKQLTLEEALDTIHKEIPPSQDRDSFVNFVKSSERGICR